MKILLFLLLLISPTFAQDIEYGKPSELKGLTKIFIDAGSDVENRNRIVKEIEKSLKVEILDSIDEAQVTLVFRTGEPDKIYIANSNATATVNNNMIYGTSQTMIIPINRRTGSGVVAIQGKNRARLLFSGEYIQKGLLLDKPATKFAKDFVKAYKKANEGSLNSVITPVPMSGDPKTISTSIQSPNKVPSNTLPPQENKTIIVTPEQDGKRYNEGGYYKFMRGEFIDAESSYRTAISAEPYNPIYHSNLAASLNAQRKFDEAEKEMDLASRLSPDTAKFKEYLDYIRSNKNKGTFYKIQPNL